MNELHIVRGIVRRIGRGLPASAPLAKAVLQWAQPHRAWILPVPTPKGERLGWQRLIDGVANAPPVDEPRPHALLLSEELARLLALDPIDGALLSVMIACDRLPRVPALVRLVSRHGVDLPVLLGELAGADANDAERIVRRSPVLRLGLVGFFVNREGEVRVDVRWALERLLDRAPASGPAIIDWLVGHRQAATLALADFAHVEPVEFLVRLLRGAATARAKGINILIHGPPGTGKTELARTLADAAGVALHAIGEADVDGDEPDRWERVSALALAQRLLDPRGQAALLFDEMEDMIGDARPASRGDWVGGRAGSKVFVNRMLEENPVPVIWTTNAIGNVDNAILRRMSFILKLDMPSRATAMKMLGRIAADEQVVPGARFGTLIDVAPEAATVLRMATRAGRLAGEADGGARSAEALVRALRGGELSPEGPERPDLDLFETDLPIAPLFDAMRTGGATDVSLLLTGPPGTGKTALAHHLARSLDRPLIIKRASDLLSKWVGETEAKIAEAFAEARQRGGVLLLDEADSLLFDRSTARTSWEVGQVNELLTWLDRHPLPVVAATNHAHMLDPATLRRFVFKLDLRPLGPERAAKAFVGYFNMPPTAELHALQNLTPGDFAVVARQLRFAPARDAGEIVARLARECDAKPERGSRVGF